MAAAGSKPRTMAYTAGQGVDETYSQAHSPPPNLVGEVATLVRIMPILVLGSVIFSLHTFHRSSATEAYQK